MTSITPFLWFANNVPEAVAFYKAVFPNAKVETVSDFMAVFELEGQRFHALNGGPQYRFTEAVSFFISVETQAEVDYFWSRLTADGGEESRCGWLKDKFGLSWQVIPSALGRYLGDPDRTKSEPRHAGDDGDAEDRHRGSGQGVCRGDGAVGWAKARSSRAVPTVLPDLWRDGGHGARAPLPTLRSQRSASPIRLASLYCRPSAGW